MTSTQRSLHPARMPVGAYWFRLWFGPLDAYVVRSSSSCAASPPINPTRIPFCLRITVAFWLRMSRQIRLAIG